MTVRLTSLQCYPLKSAAGLSLPEGVLTERGLQHDRWWMAVDPDGRFLSQRELPRLACIRPRLDGSQLHLQAAGQPILSLSVPTAPAAAPVPVRVWKDHGHALDEGPACATWLSTVLQQPSRLVRFAPTWQRRSDPRWTGGLRAGAAFADAFALLVIGAASLRDLNMRLPAALPMQRFRPNLVIEGLEPYGEDQVAELYDDEVCLRLVKPCTRCVITTTDQQSGLRDGEEPLRTLRSYRYDDALKGVCFGQNAIVVRGAGRLLRVGQTLRVRWR